MISNVTGDTVNDQSPTTSKLHDLPNLLPYYHLLNSNLHTTSDVILQKREMIYKSVFYAPYISNMHIFYEMIRK